MMANRANSLASTGPRTLHGRAKSAKNALRHALSLPIQSVPAFSQQIEMLAREIAGNDADEELADLARQIAAAQIDICRVRQARHRFLSQALSKPYYESRADRRMKGKLMLALLRPKAPEIPPAIFTKFITATPQGPQKFAIILSEEVNRLRAFDRYERRALSRRKFAIRDFDEAECRKCA
jgi:hypothetical protein